LHKIYDLYLNAKQLIKLRKIVKTEKSKTTILIRLASLSTFIIMIVALSTTKMTILENDGFWLMMHASRTDWAMLMGSVFLMITGGGAWSLDGVMRRKHNN